MRRVLICTVGGQPQPVVTAVRENQPLDLVYFLCSQGRAPSSSAHTIRLPTTRQVKGSCPHCGKDFVDTIRMRPLAELAQLEERQYVIEGIEDPDDLEQVLAACARIESDIASRWRDSGVEVISNYTGGTKTMSLGLGFYSLDRTRVRWTLQLNRVAAGGRTDLIGVRGGDQPVFQDPSKTLSDAAVRWAEVLASQCDYQGAVRVLSNALTAERPAATDQARLLSSRLRYQLLAAREGFAYAEALELSRQDPELERLYASRLELLVRIVSALESQDRWPDAALHGLELVDELRETAERSADRLQFDEAVSRLYRAVGLLAQLRLRRLYGIGPRSFDPRQARIREGLQVEARPAKLELTGAYQLLCELGDPLGRYWAQHREAVEQSLDVKRRSIYGDGMISVSRESWLALAPRWRQWLDGAEEIL